MEIYQKVKSKQAQYFIFQKHIKISTSEFVDFPSTEVVLNMYIEMICNFRSSKLRGRKHVEMMTIFYFRLSKLHQKSLLMWKFDISFLSYQCNIDIE